MKAFFLFVWAVIRFIPAAIYATILALLFYCFVKVPKENSSAKDSHNYLDHFDNI